MTQRAPRPRRWLAACVLPALVAGSAWWLYQPAPTAHTDARPALASPASTGGRAPSPSTPATSTAPSLALEPPAPDDPVAARTPVSLGPEPFAGSLAGTDIDGALKANSTGDLIVDLETRDFFDYFLSAVGEVAPEQALDQIRTLATTSLPPAAAEQAMTLLDQYLAYKQQALALESAPLDPARQGDPDYQQQMLRQAFTDLKRLRQSVFSPEAHAAFFGLEEAYGEYTLDTLDIARRTDLSPSAKTALMAWHREQLPAPLRQTEQRLIESNQSNQQRIEIMTTASSPEQAGQQLREQGMSVEAATGVTDYLREREGFERRYQEYREALTHLQTAGLAEADLAAQRTRLLHQHFPDEQQQTWARLEMLASKAP